MTIGLVGRKTGMTRIFNEDGQSVPVSVIEFDSNRVTRVMAAEGEGYNAIQVTTGSRKTNRTPKTAAGQFSKTGVTAGRGLWEFRLEDGVVAPEVGAELSVDTFEIGQKVDVSGTSKGKGFQGGVKRWNFAMQDATHGNSVSHRAPGSIGQCQSPGRVFKGKKMAGHMGAEQVTAQTLEVVRVDQENNLLLVKGAVPGAKGGDIIVKPSVKARK